PSHQLWEQTEPLIINDVAQDDRTDALRSIMLAEGFQAYAIFPLTTAQNDLLGALITYRDHKTLFSAAEITLGQTLAHLCALAILNIQLLDETRLNLLHERQHNNITRALASALNLPTILGQVIHLAAKLVGADAGLLGLVIDNQVMTFYPYNIPDQIVLRPMIKGHGVAWRVVSAQETIHIANYPVHPLSLPKWVQAGVKAVVSVPITINDDCLGALSLLHLVPSAHCFSSREITLLESVGRQTGIAIQHVRMVAEERQRTVALRSALSRQAELDELKNQFVQNVSHELRTPLGIIFGHAELLDSGAFGEIDGRQKETLQIIIRRVRMLIDLVNDLTALLAAETQEMRRETINPVYLLYSMLSEYRLQVASYEISLEAEFAKELPMIEGDITHLRRVFDNLVTNACKFTLPGGTVTLRSWAEAGDVLIEVTDTGVGIPEEKLQRIFERFFQIREKSTSHRPGTGLGLALVQEIVEAHRGELSVSSEVDVGTTFRIMLPGIAS
ncbi:MAG: GAF domain-containing protein, partial [Chloroflexi bacterium]|nr:GAF domain-containing protein [Chloroflexota bacterium]